MNWSNLGVRLAIEACDEFWKEKEGQCPQKCRPLVAASLGPYGAYLHDGSEYTGSYLETMKTEVRRWSNSIMPHIVAKHKYVKYWFLQKIIHFVVDIYPSLHTSAHI